MRSVLVAAVVVLSGCGQPPAVTVSPTPTPTASVALPSPSPAPTVTQAPGATKSPFPPRDDLAARLHPIAPAGWRPAGPTLILAQQARLDGTTLVAVPITTPPATAVPLVDFSRGTYQLRSDAGALAVALQTAPTSGRIATWDLQTGATRWVTPDEEFVVVNGPVWSADGKVIYYGATQMRPAPTFFADLGLYRINADGTGRTRIHGPDGNGGQPQRLTPDGRGLVWERTQAGGSAEVLDLATGGNTTFTKSEGATSLAWRSARPRALVVTGVCCAGPPGGNGTLHLWDDLAGTERILLDRNSTPPVAAGSADWDPTGTKIAVSVYDRSNGFPDTASIEILDPVSGARRAVPGTTGASSVRWLQAGIVYSTDQRTAELFLVSVDGSTRVSLYKATSPYVVGDVIGQ